MTRTTDTDRNVRRRPPRSPIELSYEAVRHALEELGGESCTVSLSLRTFSSIDPGSRLDEFTWSARIVCREDGARVIECEAEEPTPGALVKAMRLELERQVTRQAADRRDSKVPMIVHTTTAPRRIRRCET